MVGGLWEGYGGGNKAVGRGIRLWSRGAMRKRQRKRRWRRGLRYERERERDYHNSTDGKDGSGRWDDGNFVSS